MLFTTIGGILGFAMGFLRSMWEDRKRGKRIRDAKIENPVGGLLFFTEVSFCFIDVIFCVAKYTLGGSFFGLLLGLILWYCNLHPFQHLVWKSIP